MKAERRMERGAKSTALRLREQSGASDQASPAERSRRRRGGVVRCYELALYPNTGKAESARYAIWWAQRLCEGYLQRLHGTDDGYESTAGLGVLANQQQARARNILRAGRAAERATGQPFGCPMQAPAIVDAAIGLGTGTTFAYWVKSSCGPWMPAQTHRGLSRALRAGGTLRPRCEVRRGRSGGLVARVFVEYERRRNEPTNDVIGADVGVNVGVATSDGRCSPNLRPIMQRTRERNAERQRQGHRCRSGRTALKQHLDREARRLVMLAKRGQKTIAVERLKTLGNLKPSGRMGGWARRHFGERVRQIAEIAGVAVIEVHPAYTSQHCRRCGHTDRANRRGVQFECQRCGARAHADVNAARNLVRKATGAWLAPSTKAGHTNTNGGQVPLAGGA